MKTISVNSSAQYSTYLLLETINEIKMSNRKDITSCDLSEKVTVPSCVQRESVSTTVQCKCSIVNRRTTVGPLVFVLLAVVILGLTSSVDAMPGAYLCHAKIRCLHGGVLRVPDNPFDYCRCHCPKQYAGLRCEFNKKIRRANRLKRLVKLKAEFRELLENRRHSKR